MDELKGLIVRSISGHDKGQLMVVVGVDDLGRLLLANGKTRKLEAPKKKRKKHVVRCGSTERLTAEGMLTNRRLRRALKQIEFFLETEKG